MEGEPPGEPRLRGSRRERLAGRLALQGNRSVETGILPVRGTATGWKPVQQEWNEGRRGGSRLKTAPTKGGRAVMEWWREIRSVAPTESSGLPRRRTTNSPSLTLRTGLSRLTAWRVTSIQNLVASIQLPPAPSSSSAPPSATWKTLRCALCAFCARPT